MASHYFVGSERCNAQNNSDCSSSILLTQRHHADSPVRVVSDAYLVNLSLVVGHYGMAWRAASSPDRNDHPAEVTKSNLAALKVAGFMCRPILLRSWHRPAMGFWDPFALGVFDGVEVPFPAHCTGVQPQLGACFQRLNLRKGQGPVARSWLHLNR